MEKYYGLKRDVRFISLKDRFDPDVKIEESSVQKIKATFTEVKDTEESAGILSMRPTKSHRSPPCLR